jgi:hypothetical protein
MRVFVFSRLLVCVTASSVSFSISFFSFFLMQFELTFLQVQMEAWEGYREDDFPKLGQSSTSSGGASTLSLEDLVAKFTMDISKLQEDSKVAKDEMKVIKEREKKHEEFLRFWSGRDVQVVAGAILKWSCGKRSVKDGDGRHLFAPEAALSVTVSDSGKR